MKSYEVTTDVIYSRMTIVFVNASEIRVSCIMVLCMDLAFFSIAPASL